MYQRPQPISDFNPGNMMPMSAKMRNTGQMMPPNQGVANKFTGNSADLMQNPQNSTVITQLKQRATQDAKTGMSQFLAGSNIANKASNDAMSTAEFRTDQLLNKTKADIIEKMGGQNIERLAKNKEQIFADVKNSVQTGRLLMQQNTNLGMMG